jgi:hypothetical protein
MGSKDKKSNLSSMIESISTSNDPNAIRGLILKHFELRQQKVFDTLSQFKDFRKA